MSNKSLDILEEQFFNILKEYVPQTGRGFSDGNEHVGKKTKGPYEYVAEEDTPWYKKKYKEDSKNLKILIGHGSKTPKYAKKGGPFTQDPPKRRPVNKLSAPPMALDEVALPQTFKDAFLKLTNAQINFKPLKDIDVGIFTIFEKDKIYQGVISGDKIFLKATEKGDKTLSKQEFLEKLEEAEGELCQSVNCNVSTIKSNGKTLTFNQFIEQVNQPQPTEEPKKGIQQPAGQENQQAQKEAELVSNVGQRVASGSSVETAIKQEFGYNPLTKEFAKQFYQTMSPALQQIKDPDEKKVAALTTILLGEVSLIPVELVANVYSSIDPEIIASLSGVIDNLAKQFAPEIIKLKAAYQQLKGIVDKGKETIEKGKEAIEKGMEMFQGQSLNSIPPAKEGMKEILVISDIKSIPTQDYTNTIVNGIISRLQSNKGYQVQSEEGENLVLFGDSISGDIETGWEKEYLDEYKKSVGIIILYFNEQAITPTTPDFLTEKIKKDFPNSNIIWIGATKSSDKVKKEMSFSSKAQEDFLIKTYNAAVSVASLGKNSFIFIEPNQYIIGQNDYKQIEEDEYVKDIVGQRIYDGTKIEPKKEEGEAEESKDINDYLYGDNSFNQLDENFKQELIKLSKAAKKAFGNETKLRISSAIRGNSNRHKSKKTADLVIHKQGIDPDANIDKTRKETYAFILKSIINGTIKDGGLGYYANEHGFYNKKAMTTEGDGNDPHYDNYGGVMKWFWFKCDPNNIDKCKSEVNSQYFKERDDEEKEKQNNEEYQTSSNLTAAQVASTQNPLSLPDDVFKLIGGSSAPTSPTQSEKPQQTSEEKKTLIQTTATKLNGLPPADKTRNKIVITGNSQSSAFSEGLRSFLKEKGYAYDNPEGNIYRFTISNSNPADLIRNEDLKKYLSENKNKVAGVLVVTGLNGRSKEWYEAESKNLVKYVRDAMPDAQIIWVGSPVIQKGREGYKESNAQRKANNQGIRSASESEKFIFIDPFDYMSENSYVSKDNLHVTNSVAKKVIEGAIRGIAGSADQDKTSKKIGIDNSQNNNVNLIQTKFTEAKIPKKLTYAAIVNSWYESGWYSSGEGDKAKDLAKSNKCAEKVLEQEGDKANCGGGLFGIHSCGGRGGCRATDTNAMSLADIKDPEKSIAKIISDINNNRGTGNILSKSKEEDTTVEDLVEHFCYHVENPKNKATRCKERRSTTDSILKKAGITDYNA